MNETTKRIKELRNEVDRINHEIFELERKNSNYYIGVYSVGNCDYWDDYYCQLGFITEEQAKTWAKDKRNEFEDVYSARYFEVTEEIYEKFGEWRSLYKLQESIAIGNPAIGKLEGADRFKEVVDEAVTNLTKEIGIEHPSFMYPEI